MSLFNHFILLCLGLTLLWKTGELAVRYAVGFSLIYKVEKFTVGFFIFAISTGLPEISTAVISSFQKVPELSGGNLMGASLVNLTLVLGVATLIGKRLDIDSALRRKLYPTMALILIIFVGIAIFPIINLFTSLSLIILYFVSGFWFRGGMTKKAVTEEFKEVEHKIEKKPLLPPKISILLKLLGSLLFLIMSSWVTIRSATTIAQILKLHLSAIGATLIAVGTTFPELALEIQAVRKKEYALAIGDIFGSSLVNVSLVLGILTLANPGINLSFVRQILPFLLIVLAWILSRLLKKKSLITRDGIFFLTTFCLYIAWMAIFQLPLMREHG